MRKSALAIAIGALTISASAGANWYVQGDLGVSRIKSSGGWDIGHLGDNVFDQRIGAGYDFGNFRLALDYNHIGKAEENYRTPYETGTVSAETHSFGVSAIYDLHINTSFTPYIGVRLSENNIKFKDNWKDVDRPYSESDSWSKTRFGYGALAGVQYNLTNNLLLNFGVEYNRLGKVEDVKVNQYGAKIGLRYNF